MTFRADDPFWLLTERGYYSLQTQADRMQTMQPDQIQQMKTLLDDRDDEDDEFGAYSDLVSRHGNVATVQVTGKLLARADWIDHLFGMYSYDDIVNAVAVAGKTEGVEAVVMVVDSPGGSASGADEAATELKRIDTSLVPVYAYNAAQMCSGAMWLGSAARKIGIGRLGMAGSIGVLMVHKEMSEMLAQVGIKTTVITVGEHKADGNPYEPLSESAKGVILDQMQAVFDVFSSTVAVNRGITVDSIIRQQALVYMGEAAVDHGLADQVTSLGQFIQDVSMTHGGITGFGPTEGRNTAKVSVMSKQKGASVTTPGERVQLNERQQAAVAAGASIEEVLNDPELAKVEAPEEAGAETNAEAGAEAGAEATAETEVTDPGPDPVPAIPNGMNSVYDRLAQVTEERAELKAQVADLERQVSRHETNAGSLRDIAVESIRRMQVGMNGVPADMSDMDAATVVAQYDRTAKQFNAQFPIGAAARTQSVADREHEISSGGDDGHHRQTPVKAVRFGRQQEAK